MVENESEALRRIRGAVEDATELALDRPLWRLLAASGATH